VMTWPRSEAMTKLGGESSSVEAFSWDLLF
jgi:hypothetical protein